MPSPTTRFSDRVADYERYRPGYPAEVLEILRGSAGLEPSWAVADIGSGTGISSEPFLKCGHVVYGVEPNEPMRAAAERRLAPVYPNFRSVAGTAEATGLPDASVDLVTAMQAFHWFEPAGARREFARILRPGGWVALVWNRRLTDASAFLREYEALLKRYSTDYDAVRHERVDARSVAAFFGAAPRARSIPNRQEFDYAGVHGRLLSSSYAPVAGERGHEEMLRDLRELFDRTAEGGTVVFEYETRLFFGRLN